VDVLGDGVERGRVADVKQRIKMGWAAKRPHVLAQRALRTHWVRA